MAALTQQLIQAASASRRFLEKDSRREVARFILSRQNPDGGFRGRSDSSDLYYTVFAAGALKALGWRVPVVRLWRYIHSFGDGEGLDLVHLVCLIRLRTVFPMFGGMRRRLLGRLQEHRTDSAYDLFIKLLAEDYLDEAQFPDEELQVSAARPTTNLASAAVVNRNAESCRELLLERYCPEGGFTPGDRMEVPDLLSTATALFAFSYNGWSLDDMRDSCLRYVESLWCDSGGFSGHAADQFEDVEYTFYGLLSIGCLMS